MIRKSLAMSKTSSLRLFGCFVKKPDMPLRFDPSCEKKNPCGSRTWWRKQQCGNGPVRIKALSARSMFSMKNPCKVGCECGSDVSFFFSKGSAYCYGRGEKIDLLPPLHPQIFWLQNLKKVFPHLQCMAIVARLVCQQRSANIFTTCCSRRCGTLQ